MVEFLKEESPGKYEELFIVLLPTGEVLSIAEDIQSELADIYDLYHKDQVPKLHVTIDKIKKDSLLKAQKVLKDLCQDTPPIRLKVDKLDCFHLKNKFLILNVEATKSLKNFSTHLHQALAKKGITTIENYQEWMFHITIISNIFAENPIPMDELTEICLFMEGMSRPLAAAANKIEPRMTHLMKNLITRLELE